MQTASHWRTLLSLVLLIALQAQAAVPPAANGYKRLYVKAAYTYWGIDAPLSAQAGQIHQESWWRCDAESPFAQGCAQFTPQTRDWIAKIYPDALGAPDSFSPSWSFKAQILYMRRLYKQC
ncbi:MAG: lytic transglycosylase domain-containing protein, partial [Gammaproteobacteria bacterium]